MTLLGDKMIVAGFDRGALEIKTIAKNWLQNGGSRQAWIQALDDAADEMRSAGHGLIVGNDRPAGAGTPHPMPGKGHMRSVGNDQSRTADARQPITSEADHKGFIQQDRVERVPSAGDPIPSAGHHPVVASDQSDNAGARNPITGGKAINQLPTRASRSAPPAREPSRADLDAMKEAGELTYFQMIKLRSRAWSIYRYKDLKNVRSLNMQENMIINDVIDWGRMNRKKDDDLVSLTMPAVEMKKIVRRAQSAIQTADLILAKPKRGARRG